MSRFLMSVVLAAGLAGVVGCQSGTRADDKKADDPKATDKKDAEPPKMTPEARAALDLDAAFRLARTGRETRSPILLIAAAKVIGGTSVRKFDAKEGEKIPGEEFDPVAEAGKLLDEAIKLAGPEVDAVKTLAAATRKEIAEVKRGAIPGPQVRYGTLPPGDPADVFWIRFRGHQAAFIRVNNYTNLGDIDLYVFDQHGHLVARDARPDDDARVHFHPFHDGWYRVVVKKYRGAGPHTIRYVLTTN